jgi:hypothetical protein
MLYNTSKKVEELAKKYKKKGYSINQTTDSYFLKRQPQNRKDMKRVGVFLGTGGGSNTSTSIFAYKDKKIPKKGRKKR